MFFRYPEYYDCNENEVVATEISKPLNLERLEKFLENVKNNNPDAIRTIIIGIEGDPRIYHIFYDKEKFLVVKDSTNKISPYGSKSITLYQGDSIKKEKKDKYIIYKLYKDDIEQTRIFTYDENLLYRRRR